MSKTLREYMLNPSGLRANTEMARMAAEQLYSGKFQKLLERENGHFDYTLYEGKGAYVAHVKVPSEAVPNFYYDVVFKMTSKLFHKNLEDYDIQFFSNDPAFNYTWAYAFKKHRLTISELEGKMSKVAIKTAPKQTNPDRTVGYVKTLYFAYLYLKSKGLFAEIRFKTEAQKLDWKYLNKLIKPTDQCIQERQDAEAKLNKKKGNKEVRKDDIKHPEIHSRSNDNLRAAKKITTTGKVGTVKRSGTVKKSHKIGGKR